MELIDVKINNKGQLTLVKYNWFYGRSFFHPYPTPKIILTKTEAKKRGINYNIKGGKGFCCVIDGRKVPIDIK